MAALLGSGRGGRRGSTPPRTAGAGSTARRRRTSAGTGYAAREALVAQGIEHRSPKAGVAGSNPAGGTSSLFGAVTRSSNQDRNTPYSHLCHVRPSSQGTGPSQPANAHRQDE